MRHTRHQLGTLKLAERKKGKVWEFRWRDVQSDGSIRRKNIVIGTLSLPKSPYTLKSLHLQSRHR
jgi:hypothetical protein